MDFLELIKNMMSGNNQTQQPSILPGINTGLNTGQVQQTVPTFTPPIPQPSTIDTRSTVQNFVNQKGQEPVHPKLDFLKRLAIAIGPQAAAAIIGSMSDAALPAASGFSKGLTNEQVKQRETKQKNEQDLKLEEVKTGRTAKREERLVNQQEFTNTTRLRNEFIKLPEVADFVTISTNIDAMDKLLNNAKNDKSGRNDLALDQALITMFNKLTDPASVVRESEYARTGKNTPFANYFVGSIRKLKAGGAGLTDKDRDALVAGAKIILQARSEPYNSAVNDYSTMATQYGLDPNMVIKSKEVYTGNMSGLNSEEEKRYQELLRKQGK